MALEKQVRGWNATRAESAARLDVDQSRVTSILNGRINDFSVDELLVLAGKAGLTVQMDIRDAA
jgi:predicted XRE-type DNA-binding protein